MRSFILGSLWVGLGFALLGPGAGCDDPEARDVDAPSTAERGVGEAIDDGLEDVGGAVENVGDTVRSGVTDLQVAARVKKALADDDRLHAIPIDVDVEDGVVTLHGRVKTLGLRIHATSVVGDLEGVKRVENEIELAD